MVGGIQSPLRPSGVKEEKLMVFKTTRNLFKKRMIYSALPECIILTIYNFRKPLNNHHTFWRFSLGGFVASYKLDTGWKNGRK
jgi:hypothetical protein